MAVTADFTCAQCTCHVSCSLSACTIVNNCPSSLEKQLLLNDILVFCLNLDQTWIRRELVAFPRKKRYPHLALAGVLGAVWRKKIWPKVRHV